MREKPCAPSFGLLPHAEHAHPQLTAEHMLAAGGDMSSDNQHVHPGSEIDLAIDRALEAADLRAGDAATTSTAVVGYPEPSSVEVDGDAGAADGD